MKNGVSTIFEPGLNELVRAATDASRVRFASDCGEAVGTSDLVFLTVGTPTREGDGSADLSTLWAVTEGLAAHVNGPKIVVVKSTVPVGTNRGVHEILTSKAKFPVDVASNPEFLKEGGAVEDFMKPDRVVVGVRTPETGQLLHKLYMPFLRTENPFLAGSMTAGVLLSSAFVSADTATDACDLSIPSVLPLPSRAAGWVPARYWDSARWRGTSSAAGC